MSSLIVVPGQLITVEPGFVGGKGTYSSHLVSGHRNGSADNQADNPPAIVASVAGYIERIDKLISVRQVKSR